MQILYIYKINNTLNCVSHSPFFRKKLISYIKYLVGLFAKSHLHVINYWIILIFSLTKIMYTITLTLTNKYNNETRAF